MQHQHILWRVQPNVIQRDSHGVLVAFKKAHVTALLRLIIKYTPTGFTLRFPSSNAVLAKFGLDPKRQLQCDSCC